MLSVISSDDSTFAGTVSGAGFLVKYGSGKLTLNGTSTHTGPTSVSAGTLVINGTLTASDVTIDSGATLGGSGTIGGDLVVGGAHKPGNSPGIQTIAGNVTYNQGASITWELGANSETNAPSVVFDQIVVGGDLTFLGATTLNLSFDPATSGGTVDWTDIFWTTDHSWKVFDVTGATSGFGNLSLDPLSWLDTRGQAFGTNLEGASFALTQVGSDIYLNYSAAIPEPSTYGIVIGGLALAGAAIARRRRNERLASKG